MKKRKVSTPASAHMRRAPLKLIEAAGDAFAKRGFQGAALRDIADKAGLSFQLINYHFGSKDELWNAVTSQMQALRRDAMLQAAKEHDELWGKSPSSWIRRWMRTGFLFAVEDPQLRRIITQEYFANSKRYKTTIPPLLREQLVLMIDAFQRAQAGGAITAVSHVEAVFLYRALLCGTGHLPFELELAMNTPAGTPQFIEHQLDLLMRIFAKGCGVPKSHPLAAPGLKRASAKKGRTAVRSANLAERNEPLDGRQVRGKLVKERLLNAAIQHFTIHGFDGASVRNIAQEAKAAYPLVSYHFGSKKELWTAVLTHLFSQQISGIESLKFDPLRPRETQVKEWIRGAITDSHNRPSLRRIYTQEYFQNSERYRRTLKPTIEEMDRTTSPVYAWLIEEKFVTNFSIAETKILFKSVVAMNAVMPDEIRLILDIAGINQNAMDWQVNLLTRLFTQEKDA